MDLRHAAQRGANLPDGWRVEIITLGVDAIATHAHDVGLPLGVQGEMVAKVVAIIAASALVANVAGAAMATTLEGVGVGGAAAWGIALVGILNRVFSSMEKHVFSFSLMLILGWLSVPIMFPLAGRVGTGAVVLMAIGGLLYTAGMVFKVTRWPRLWPRVFSAHELFHVFVVAASAFHWTATYRYVFAA